MPVKFPATHYPSRGRFSDSLSDDRYRPLEPEKATYADNHVPQLSSPAASGTMRSGALLFLVRRRCLRFAIHRHGMLRGVTRRP